MLSSSPAAELKLTGGFYCGNWVSFYRHASLKSAIVRS
jgi:hypothetical protein